MARAFPFDLGPSSALHMQSGDDNGIEATDDSYDSFQGVLDYEAEAYRQLFVAAQSRARRRYAETGGLRPSRRRGNRRRGSLTKRFSDDVRRVPRFSLHIQSVLKQGDLGERAYITSGHRMNGDQS